MIQTQKTFANAVVTNTREGLEGIHQKTKNIAILHRQIGHLHKELAYLEDQKIECRANGSIEKVRSEMATYFETNLKDCPLMLQDITSQLNLYKQLSGAQSFRVFFSTVSTNMCRKFHTDINQLRMLCTYVGPGTLWLPSEAVDSEAYNSNSKDKSIVRDESLIQQVDTGDVALLKGAIYPEADPILHRSPTIEETKQKRLILRIDANDSLNFWA